MKNKRIICVFVLCLIIQILFFSCGLESLLMNTTPEFTVSNLSYKDGDEESNLSCGIYFDFCNTSKKTVVYIETKMNVYDKKTGIPAFNNAGTITCGFDGFLKNQESREFFISLENYSPVIFDSELVIDSFFINRIIYSDGTTWRDLLGSNSISGETSFMIRKIEQEKVEEAPEPEPEPEPETVPEPEPEPEPEPPVEPMQDMPSAKKLTLLVYMAADNDLECYALADLKEMEHAVFEEMNVLVLLDRAQGYDATDGDWIDTRLFELVHDETDGNYIVSKRLRCPKLGLAATRETELDMANPAVLSNFISYAKLEYEAEKYALILWGHGTGWRGVNIQETASSRASAIDNFSDSYMSVSTLGRALKNSNLCVIGFDTCFGGVFENVYEIKNCSEYTVASPGTTPSYGWNYKQLLEDISESDFKTTTLAQLMADSSSVETTIFDNSRLRDVMECFEAFGETLSKTIIDNDSRNSVFNTLKNLKSFCYAQNPCDVYLDMRSIAQAYSSSSNTKLAETAVRLRNSLDKAARTTYSEKPEIGIHFIPKTETGSFDVRHSLSYIKDFDNSDQCLFIKESQWWVPTKGAGSDSLLDKLFYRVY